jgi:TetR/AcrR family transcriptional repressor of nem operon
MAKETTKRSIIKHGAPLVHSKGFNNTGISDILKAAGVPKGSFYFYFKSKDEFGLALVDYYWEFIKTMGETCLSDRGIPPLERLSRFMDAYQQIFESMDLCCGCPIGNLMQEMSDLSDDFRKRVGDVYSRMQCLIGRLLEEARSRGDLSPEVDPARTAQFIMNSWEGAIMHMKLVKSSEPLKIFKQMVFEKILK